MTEEQLKEMERWLAENYSPEPDHGNKYEKSIAEKAFRAGFDLAKKPLALDRACENLDFLLKSGFFASKKR